MPPRSELWTRRGPVEVDINALNSCVSSTSLFNGPTRLNDRDICTSAMPGGCRIDCQIFPKRSRALDKQNPIRVPQEMVHWTIEAEHPADLNQVGGFDGVVWYETWDSAGT